MNYDFVFYLCNPPSAKLCAGRSIFESLQAGNFSLSGGDSPPEKEWKLEMDAACASTLGPREVRGLIKGYKSCPCKLTITRAANYRPDRDVGQRQRLRFIDVTRWRKLGRGLLVLGRGLLVLGRGLLVLGRGLLNLGRGLLVLGRQRLRFIHVTRGRGLLNLGRGVLVLGRGLLVLGRQRLRFIHVTRGRGLLNLGRGVLVLGRGLLVLGQGLLNLGRGLLGLGRGWEYLSRMHLQVQK